MANRISIIHFQPVELYPPVMNDILYLENRLKPVSLDIYTTKSTKSLFTFSVQSKYTKIKRLASLSAKGPMLYLNYFIFYFSTIVSLITRRPELVLYFETMSSMPAIFYKRFINKKAVIMVHYHEYTSASEYRDGMKLNKWFHAMEKKVYARYAWISHMIEERMDLFIHDNPGINKGQTYLLPNYPPLSWKREKHQLIQYPVKAVYIGSLSLDTMYLREFAEWINGLGGKIILDIYSYNYESSAVEYLHKLNSPFINFKNGIKYFDIPGILEKYDVGVILYKGTIQNYVFNAPNKLFEYLSADLDVWLPDVMKGSLPFTRNNCYPKILALNFDALYDQQPDQLLNREGLHHIPSTFFCESVLVTLCHKIFSSLKNIPDNSIEYEPCMERIDNMD